MKSFKRKAIVFSMLILVLSGSGILTACQSNQEPVFVYQPVALPPDEVSIEQLITDYMTDIVSADAKYKGKTFLFTGITVENIQNNTNTYPPPYDIYILSGLVKFAPRYHTGFDNIGEEFVVDLVGKCQGWQFSRIYITECWVGVVEGDVDSIPELDY